MKAQEQMIQILQDLKLNYHAAGLKGEFEDEGMTVRDAECLKGLSAASALPLMLKIGGCGAVTDLCEASRLQSERVVAPMIESPFALRKFLGFAHKFYPSDDTVKRKLMINVETETACKNFESILNENDLEMLDGIVIGRGDLALSMGLQRDEINSLAVCRAVMNVCEVAKRHKLYCVIGGNMNTDSIAFLKSLGPELVDEYETRKVSFYTKSLFEPSNCTEGIRKSLEFEILWLKNKPKGNSLVDQADAKRILKLELMLESQCTL